MTDLHLTLACGPYDRTRGLQDGRVTVGGCDVTYLPLPPEEIFHRMVSHREFDVAEMSFSSYLMTLQEPDPPFVALPVFPSRSFRLDGIYVRADDSIERPDQLVGETVGVPEYQISAAVWQRGLLEEFYGLPVHAVRYVTGGLEQPGRSEKIGLPNLPDMVEVTRADAGETLSGLLATGRIRALYTARMPDGFRRRDGRFRRLLHDPRAEGERVYRESGVFPIMHLVVLRRDLYECHRWLAVNLVTAFDEAKRRSEAAMYESAALSYQLPWLVEEIERTEDIMGRDFWPYGVTANVVTLQRFLDYHTRQGLSRGLEMSDLFAPETTTSTLI